MSIQEACEVIEELVQKETKNDSLISLKEFMALNAVLLELTISGKYKVPDKYFEEERNV